MNETSALRLPLPDLENVEIQGPDVPVSVPTALRIAPSANAIAADRRRAAPVVVLRDPDLVADLRRARAERFANPYEWLALRRRRAQIAARHELEG